MKVLILHQHFKTPYKGGAIRSYYLAAALVNAGIETIVITAHNEGLYKVEHIDGIEVHYLPIAYDNRFGFVKRSLSFIRFVTSSVTLSGKFQHVDLCYAISVPLTTGIAARRIFSRYKIPFVFEVGDLWPEAPIQMGFIKNPILKKILYDLEQKIYASAKSIVALSQPIADSVKLTCPAKEVHLIPNMSDIDFFKPTLRDQEAEKTFNVKDKFVVSYIGAIGYANGLDHLLQCAKAAAAAKSNIHFLICGDGAELDRLRKEVKQMKLDNLSIVPFQNRNGVRDILNITDAVFISYRSVPILETGSPNKYFDGLAAGKLIIINFGGWIKSEIESNKCGVYVDPLNPNSFVNIITQFVDDKALLKTYQQSARLLAERKYSRSILGDRFVQIIRNSH